MLSPKIIVATSGYYDPLHVGHLSSFEEAKKLGDWLVVIVNNDEQIKRKKGYYFMPVDERVKIISSLKCVDEVVMSIDTNELVCDTLRMIKPNIFAKGGEWLENNIPKPMIDVCKELNCKIVCGLGEKGKVHSSSKIINRAVGLVLDSEYP